MRSIRPVLGTLLFLGVVVSLSASSLALASGQPVAIAPSGAPAAAAAGAVSGAAAPFGGFQAAPARQRPETGDPVTDALRWMNWRSIGPANMSGRVSAIVGIPGDRNTWWFGSADGGV